MKKLLISLFILIALALTAIGAGELTSSSFSLTVARGYSNSAVLTVTNGNTADITGIHLEKPVMDNLTITLNPSADFNLNKGEHKDITVDIAALAAASIGLHTDNITITYNNGTDSLQIKAPLAITVEDPRFSIETPSEVSIGNAGINTTVEQTFTITNNGNAPLTTLKVLSNVDSKYAVAFQPAAITSLAPGASSSIKVNATIPLNEPAGIKSLGNIYVQSNEYNASAFPLKADIKGKLDIDRVDVEIVNGGTETHKDVKNGETISKKAKPESKVTFDIKVKNNYPKDTDNDIEIKDIVVTVTIEDIDDGDEIDEESREFDLDPQEDKTSTLEFEIPLEVDEGSYNVIINVKGEDDNSMDHEVTWELELDVDKETHEIKIRKQAVSPSTVDCNRTANLNFELMNLGKDEEEDVFYLISSPSLGINIREGPFTMDNDFDDETNTVSASHTLRIKESQAAGIYDIEIRAFYETDKIDDYKKLTIVVNECSPESEQDATEEQEDITVDYTTPEEISGENEWQVTTDYSGEQIAMPPAIDFRETKPYYALLGLGIITVLAAIVLLTAYFMKTSPSSNQEEGAMEETEAPAVEEKPKKKGRR